VRTDHQAQERVGVPGYMPPEVFRRQPYGPSVDVFAFGVVLRRLLQRTAGELALTSRVAIGFHQVVFNIYPSALGYERFVAPPRRTTWPSALVALVHACCATQPKQRPLAAEVVLRLKAQMPQGQKPGSGGARDNADGVSASAKQPQRSRGRSRSVEALAISRN